MIALNAYWLVLDIACVVFLLRNVHWRLRVALLPLVALGLLLECGFAIMRFHAMRAMCFALFIHAPLLLFAHAWVLWSRQLRTVGLGCALSAAGLVLVAVDAFVYEPHALQISKYEQPAARTLRVVVLSDFQASAIGDYERGVLKQVAQLEPELLLLAGDYVQAHGAARAQVVADFRDAWRSAGIRPRFGTLAVRGDVEPDGWENELFGGFDVLTADHTRTYSAGGLSIAMLSLRDSSNAALVLPAGAEAAELVLGHRPDYALGAGPGALLVAGHTHGGQVQIPWFGPPYILSAVPRAWGAGGLHSTGNGRSVLVTRGAGVEHADNAPPLRFNCKPELVLLQLRGR
jgi:uncharacterized protein